MVQYRYDTHVHTSETSPCGKVAAKDAVRMYKEAGYQGIIITDHFFSGFFAKLWFKKWEEKVDRFLEGYRKASEEGEKQGLDVIQAIEIKFNESPNDYLVYGADESFLKEHKELYKLGLKRFRELIKGKNILIFQAHPFRPLLKPANPSLLDGVEVYNGNPRHDSRNTLAYDFAKTHGLAMLSGSDFHQPQDLARGGIVVSERITTPTAFVDAIKNDKIHELIATE